MRPAALLLLLSLAGCATDAGPTRTARAVPEPDRDLDRVVERFREGWPEAELVLEASGEPGLARVRPFLMSEDEDLRARTLSLLLSAGEDIALTVRERVDLALYDLTRAAPQPWATLRALGQLRGVGEGARPWLEEAARGDDDRAAAAQRLLQGDVP